MFQYSGPGSQQVANQWNGINDYWFMMLAQQGYIVACVDGRGTGFKGAEFKKCTYKELGKFEVEDQIDAANHLADRLRQRRSLERSKSPRENHRCPSISSLGSRLVHQCRRLPSLSSPRNQRQTIQLNRQRCKRPQLSGNAPFGIPKVLREGLHEAQRSEKKNGATSSPIKQEGETRC